jgi:hypothetical protein
MVARNHEGAGHWFKRLRSASDAHCAHISVT